jgi:hypothetical protein
MRRTLIFILLSGITALPLLSVPAQAQTSSSWDTGGPQVVSSRDCRPPADAKEAQVLAFDRVSLEAKLAVSLEKGEFKVVSVKIWDRPDDSRPLVPVIEAARITQGKLRFYTPNLSADPEPTHDQQFLVTATLGGAQVCWATDSSLLKGGVAPKAANASAAAEAEPRKRLRQ